MTWFLWDRGIENVNILGIDVELGKNVDILQKPQIPYSSPYYRSVIIKMARQLLLSGSENKISLLMPFSLTEIWNSGLQKEMCACDGLCQATGQMCT